MTASARADLHVHSRHSNRPSEWILRRLGAPESYMDPREVYRRCRARGMEFVTLTDHDEIAGALEIAHLPGTFLSEEVTASFPEDGCQIHLLVWGVSEAQHREIQRLRGDLYELRDHLVDEGLAHAVAHPLYRVNDLLTLDHLERLLVLFQRFEARNGIHDGRSNEVVEAVFARLTPEMLADMAHRHRLRPRAVEPWKKHFTGGSDDHGGRYCATTWTETPPAATVEEFLARLAAGEHAPGGRRGSTLRLAQSLRAIAAEDYRHRFARPWEWATGRKDPFGRMLAALGREERPRTVRWALGGTLRRGVAARLGAPAIFPAASRTLPVREPEGSPPTPERAALAAADRVAGEALYDLAVGFGARIRRGDLGGALGALTHLAPFAAAAVPYVAALTTQYKDAPLVQATVARFDRLTPAIARPRPPSRPPRTAWVTDTLDDVNGVARTIGETARRAAERGRDLTVVTCGQGRGSDLPLHAFAPVAELPLPLYEAQVLGIPPLLEGLDYFERNRFDEILISTPGPLGLLALAAASLLHLKVTAIFHTDFAAYSRSLSGSPRVEEATRRYVTWFYDRAERVWARSEASRDRIVADGLPAAKVGVLPFAVDRERFHPGRRDPELFRAWGLPAGPKLLYAGRISREKNLDALLAAFASVRRGHPTVSLVLCGDGPDRAELAERGQEGVHLPGALGPDRLAVAYASADLFVFPGRSDTLGNALLEAQSCGLPAVVADQGGPQEIVRRRGSGVVADTSDPEALAATLLHLLDDPAARAVYARRALAASAAATWDRVVDALWPDTASEAAGDEERRLASVGERAV